ncbi:MAG: response regulator transcription factor [Gammaproteobacteria bacterium]|nr:response regulator transcription factor [Gammaproteobacteria bacterium]
MKILLMEDNPRVMETLVDYLELEGMETDCAYNGGEALARLREERFDVIVADIMMPGLDGISAVRRMREELHCTAPIIFLTARDSLEDKTDAFNAGGDDYLIKPFAMEELLLRIRALGRRGPLPDQQHLSAGVLDYDLEADVLRCAGQPLKLTPVQKQIMRILIQRAPAVVRRAEIEAAVWGDEIPPRDALRTHIYAIRTALAQAGQQNLLLTLHGQGYRLVID